jgi:hypothetical protein
MLQVLMGLVSWLGVLVSIAGAVVSAFAIGRTRWALVLLGGFAGEAAAGAFYRIMPQFLAFTGTGNWQAPYLLAGLVGLAAHVAVVAGVAGLLFANGRSPAV